MSKYTLSNCIALTGALLSSLAVPASAQNISVPRLAPEKGFTISSDGWTPMVLQTMPDAACDLHTQGLSDAAHTMRLYANQEGYVRVHLIRTQDSLQESRLQLDCTAGGKVTIYPVHLRIDSAASADMPAPEATIPAPQGSQILPALTDQEARQLSDQELGMRGYSPRPDPTASPERYAKWLDTFSKPITLLPQHSVSHAEISHRTRGVQESSAQSYYNWSGYSLTGSYLEYIDLVGYWHVPAIVKAESGVNTYSAFWVGIDGQSSGDPDLVQAGSESDYQDLGGGVGSANYYTWTEVLPDQPTAQEAFGVGSNDYVTISAWICNDSHAVDKTGRNACFLLNDATSGQAQLVVTAFVKTVVDGINAEWIMERPCLSACGGASPVFGELSDFGIALMMDAAAYRSTTGKWVNPLAVANTLITMVNGGQTTNTGSHSDNNTLSTALKASPTQMQFNWKNFH